MNTAVIEVAFANPKRDGKKFASIKTPEGQLFLVPPEKFGLLQPGRTYEVEFSEWEHNGESFRKIVKCRPKEAQQKAEASRAPSPEKSPRGALNAEQEFVSRLLAASIQACAVTYSEPGLIAAAKMLRKVFREAMER